MPNILKRFSRAKVQPYLFPEAEELTQLQEEVPEIAGEASEAAPEPERTPEDGGQEPVSYAQLQAERILQDARRQAEELLEKAGREAERRAEEACLAAEEEGRRSGYAQGLAQAMEEGARQRVRLAGELGGDVQRFLQQAGDALDSQLDANVSEMRDLAMAVAEKVVCVSLKSSADVIARMIQTAVDKRKRREWVHIYIADCDAKRMARLPASLTAALSALSDRVRLVPIAGDESGSCLIEMPDEIVDASVSTQMNNLRALLAGPQAGGGVGDQF